MQSMYVLKCDVCSSKETEYMILISYGREKSFKINDRKKRRINNNIQM